MIPRRSTDTRGKHLANVSPADEQDVKPYGIRPNRNAARENDSNDRSPHNIPADRTKIFFPDGGSDDPRASLPAENSRRLAENSRRFLVALAAALAGDVIVPDAPLALSR